MDFTSGVDGVVCSAGVPQKDNWLLAIIGSTSCMAIIGQLTLYHMTTIHTSHNHCTYTT